MIYSDAKLQRALAPFIQRVLIVDATPSAARLLADLLKDLGAREITVEHTDTAALAACKRAEPQMVFTELGGRGLDGLHFVRALRRSDLAARQAPVIVVTTEATAAAIVASRNAGVHEFLKKPFMIRDLTRRLEAVTLRHRDWVEAVNYIGPDRRRFNSGDYDGPRKRKVDHRAEPDSARIAQALKILKSAIAAIETDPAQAVRAMQAQAVDLHKAGVVLAHVGLISAVAVLQRAVNAAAAGAPSRAAIEAAAAGLWAFMPAEAAQQAAA